MDHTALLLSRIQFGFTISFHIIFSALAVGLAAWPASAFGDSGTNSTRPPSLPGGSPGVPIAALLAE